MAGPLARLSGPTRLGRRLHPWEISCLLPPILRLRGARLTAIGSATSSAEASKHPIAQASKRESAQEPKRPSAQEPKRPSAQRPAPSAQGTRRSALLTAAAQDVRAQILAGGAGGLGGDGDVQE